MLGLVLVVVACFATREPPRAIATPHVDLVDASAVDVGDAAVSVPPDDEPFATLRAPIEAAIADGKLPGCVVVVGRRDRILFRRAYGSRSVEPTRTTMTEDTLFDLASLTKPIATATSIMILVERGKISLDAPASKYLPELASLPPFTVRQLLLHESGLVADTPKEDYAGDREAALRKIAAHKLAANPGEKFIYSDAGFIVLGEIVRRVSGVDLATFAKREIFTPLAMDETEFNPPQNLKARAAPTEERDGGWMVGEVHDPRAWGLGGVAGHAGLFSTADDLARFARAMLGRGALDGARIFSRTTSSLFFTRQPNSLGGRTLGWDGASHVFSAHAFGHGGFTGTSLWIDPDQDLFVVFLSNRVHPDGKGQVNPLIAQVDALAIDASKVATGIDVLVAEHFEPLRGARPSVRVGLITNTSAKTRDGVTTIDAFKSASAIEAGVKLVALFSPEHGLDANRDSKISDSDHDGIPVHSLYGDHLAPDASWLDGLDALVFDLQDVGVRFYTYASTMRRAMRAAADHHVRFVVLDRPNPLGGVDVEGPVFSGAVSFVNHAQIPVRHGMTMGELAKMFAHDDADDLLEVIRMWGWHRDDLFDATGLAWSSPSPNLRTFDEVLLYPALGLLEGTNVSVGRGTSSPFEQLGAPWIDAALAHDLASAQILGVAFQQTTFTPDSSIYKHETCHGVRVTVTDRKTFDPIRTGIAIALALHARYAMWKLDDMSGILGSASTLEAIRRGDKVTDIARAWATEVDAFRTKRAAFLLYR